MKAGLLGPVALAAEATSPFGAEELVAAAAAAAAAAVSAEPVSIWTTCLKEEVSAWTNVVGYGFGSQVLGMDLGVRDGGARGDDDG